MSPGWGPDGSVGRRVEGETTRGWARFRPLPSSPLWLRRCGGHWPQGFKGPAQVQLLPLVAMLSRTATLLQTDNLSLPLLKLTP